MSDENRKDLPKSENDNGRETYEKDPNRPQRLRDLFFNAADTMDNWQTIFRERARECGYSRDIYSRAGEQVGNLPDNPIFQYTEKALNRFRLYCDEKERLMQNLPTKLDGTAFTIVTTTASASPYIKALGGDPTPLTMLTTPVPEYWPPNRAEIYARKLDMFDKECGKLYRAIWETFYGTGDNPERAALFLTRQLFDHFFDKLAPKDKLVNLKKESGDIEAKITRKDRIIYVANTHVKERSEAELLAAQAEYVDDVYNDLNKLHKRGPLEREEVRQLINAMRAVIERFIDAIHT